MHNPLMLNVLICLRLPFVLLWGSVQMDAFHEIASRSLPGLIQIASQAQQQGHQSAKDPLAFGDLPRANAAFCHKQIEP